jgi:hypothetical protein
MHMAPARSSLSFSRSSQCASLTAPGRQRDPQKLSPLLPFRSSDLLQNRSWSWSWSRELEGKSARQTNFLDTFLRVRRAMATSVLALPPLPVESRDGLVFQPACERASSRRRETLAARRYESLK